MSSRTVIMAILVVGLAVTVAAVVLYLADPSQGSQFRLEFAKVLMQLGLIGVVAMIVKHIVEDYAANRREEAARAQRDVELEQARHAARVKALTELTDGYWAVKKSLYVILAHKSAKSYGEQMREVIDHRLALQRIDNEIASGMYALEGAREIGDALMKIDKQLEGVIDEWKQMYLDLSQMQTNDERRPPDQKEVPRRIETLPQLASIAANGFALIHEPFEEAARRIRSHVMRPGRERATGDAPGASVKSHPATCAPSGT